MGSIKNNKQVTPIKSLEALKAREEFLLRRLMRDGLYKDRKKDKAELPIVRACILYTEKNPKVEFVLKQKHQVEKKLKSLNDQWYNIFREQRLEKLSPGELGKIKRKFFSIKDKKVLLYQLKVLNYLITF